jgi:hypothetical protein
MVFLYDPEDLEQAPCTDSYHPAIKIAPLNRT